jgi:hypothetical protein
MFQMEIRQVLSCIREQVNYYKAILAILLDKEMSGSNLFHIALKSLNCAVSIADSFYTAAIG